MGASAMTVLMLTSLLAFCLLAWRKLGIVSALQPEPRTDHPGARLWGVLVDGFLQRRMLRLEWKPGLMHTVIFLGFMILLLRKLQLIAIGYDESFAVANTAGGLFATLKDMVELCVLAAVGYALYRRLLARPARLEPNREGLLVLSLIAVIMVTDLLFDGFRFALLAPGDTGIAHERAWAPVGRLLGDLFAALSPTLQHAGYQVSYWTQMLTVFGFLVLLPTGEHFHIVTALPTLFFRRLGPSGVVPQADLESVMRDDASDQPMRLGVATAADLVWKDALDAFTCTECGRCKDACPTFLTGKPLSQKWVHDDLKHHLLARRADIVGDVASRESLPPLIGEVIRAETLWACTTCGYCEAACPISLEHLPKFFRMRQHQVMMEGAFPSELKPVFHAYEVQSNAWGLPADTRGDWARDLDVPVIQEGAQARDFDWLFYVGSAQSFDRRAQRVARAFVEILREAGVSFAILGPRETSTGECVRRLGNELLFQELAGQLVATLNGAAVTRIVTCDPHAFNSLKNEYPAFGGQWEVVHHTQLLTRLLAEGRIRTRASETRVVFHDPCYLGRHNAEFEAPRAVLGHVLADSLLEMPLNRTRSMCCGAGGGRMWMEEMLGSRINVLRAEQALACAPTAIATACPYCTTMLEDGLKAKGADEDVKVLDVAELVARAMVRSGACTPPGHALPSAGD